MKILKPVLISIAVVFVIICGIYIAMFASTNSLMKYAESVFSGETIIENEDNPLWRYSLSERYFPETEIIEYDLKRIFVIHNFKEGKMNVLYRLHYADENGKTLYNSVAQSTWYIKKVDGEWVVYDIDEAP